MEELKLLISIAKRGGVGEKVRITLRELSQEIGTSPQSVMRKLEALEKEPLLK